MRISTQLNSHTVRSLDRVHAGRVRVVGSSTCRSWVRLGLAVLLGAVTAACAHTQAKTILEMPPLDMPSAPPRIVETPEPPPPAVIALPDDTPQNIRPRPATPPRAEAPRQTEPKVETPVEPPKPTEEPRPAPTTVQTAPTQREAEIERRVRGLIARTSSDLSRVDYKALNIDARNQYDSARRFAAQAEDALKARNMAFASNLADKAAALAAQLAGR